MHDGNYHTIEYRNKPTGKDDDPDCQWQLWAKTLRGRGKAESARDLAEGLLHSMLDDEGWPNPAVRVDGGRAITRRQLQEVADAG